MATERIPFDPEDFTPILRIQVDPFLVAVRDDSPFRTLGDLFEAAHARPGEVSMSSPPGRSMMNAPRGAQTPRLYYLLILR